jgi:hypothetical protein
MVPVQPPTGQPVEEQELGGQTGSGDISWHPISCEEVKSEDCEASLLAGFGVKETPLVPAGSECVTAATLDSTLDDFPVCRCEYTQASYFSDTFGVARVEVAVGLDRRRVALGDPSEGCDARYRGGLCLLEPRAFAGCSIEDSTNSCDSVCRQVSYNHARAFSARDVEVLATNCVRCNYGYCTGVLRSDDGRCYFAQQEQLNGGYTPSNIPCEDSPAAMLDKHMSRWLAGSQCRVDAGVVAPTTPEPYIPDGGTNNGAGAAELPDASGLTGNGDSGSDAG